jgi:RNA polymerase-interacting CarD/CdnL/TRCF family regulator
VTSIAQTAVLPARVRARRGSTVKATLGIWLEVGEPIRYQGLGAGRVIAHELREFRGEECTFAVISFPHREMTAQIPLGEAAAGHKLRPVISAPIVKRLLAVVGETGAPLPRTWDDREESGTKRLRDGSPQDWAELLRDYAWARKGGMAITSSDADLVRDTLDLLAAEYACAAEVDFIKAMTLVQGAYDRACA